MLVSVVKDTISFADPEFHKREMKLVSSRNATNEDFALVVKKVRDGTVPTAALNTHRASIDQAVTELPKWLDPAAGVIKAIIEV